MRLHVSRIPKIGRQVMIDRRGSDFTFLQKYTPVFLGMRCEDIILLSDEDLQRIGVSTIGARRKMIKVCVP